MVKMYYVLQSTFHVDIERTGFLTYRLYASQILPLRQEVAFRFFEDPENLVDITPPSLDFHLLHKKGNHGVYEGAEFDYTIKLLGIKTPWRSRIIEYHPPERFTDIQLRGPYKSWVHLHTLKQIEKGTLMTDHITYKLYLPALILHSLLIRKQLIDIFSYRAVKIAEWAETIASVKGHTK
jgi:ligand-binding SRPBCC domain-containing protein